MDCKIHNILLEKHNKLQIITLCYLEYTLMSNSHKEFQTRDEENTNT